LDVELRDHPSLAVLKNLPRNKMTVSDQVHENGKEPVDLFSYQYLLLCDACSDVHPIFARNMGYYLMRPFLSPKVEMPTHFRRPLPPPTSFYHVDEFRHSIPAMNATVYGHLTEGFYITPLAVILEDGHPNWWITFGFKSCYGVRE
jgi:hypothetical protein